VKLNSMQPYKLIPLDCTGKSKFIHSKVSFIERADRMTTKYLLLVKALYLPSCIHYTQSPQPVLLKSVQFLEFYMHN